MKTIALTCFLAVSLAFSALTYIGDGIYHMDSFYDNGNFSTSQTLQMDWGDNLLIDMGSGAGSIAQTPYLTGRWHLGLVDEQGWIVGWAYNPLRDDNDGNEGLLYGAYSYELGEGNKPAGVYLVYDALDNGFHIDYDTGLIGLAIDVAEGDLFFTEQDILFNGSLGDLSQLPPYGPVNILPSMTLIIHPQNARLITPANGAVGVSLEVELSWEGVGDCTYNVYFGTSPETLELAFEGIEQESVYVGNLDWSTDYYWQVESVYAEESYLSVLRFFTTAGFRCAEVLPMDFNGDCRVDLLDLSLFAEYWLVETERVEDN